MHTRALDRAPTAQRHHGLDSRLVDPRARGVARAARRAERGDEARVGAVYREHVGALQVRVALLDELFVRSRAPQDIRPFRSVFISFPSFKRRRGGSGHIQRTPRVVVVISIACRG